MANIQKLSSGRWRARYRDQAGREHAKHFKRRVDGQRWLDEVTTSVVTGQYVDPSAGRIAFREYAEHWREIQAHRPSTKAHVETNLRLHVYPTLGARPISSILPSDVQALVTRLELAPATVGVIHALMAGIFKSAVRDRRIIANPCEGTRLPEVVKKRIVPLETSVVLALRDAMPDEVKAVITTIAGTGPRQGEVFGLTRDRVNFLRREIHIDRQLVGVVDGQPVFGPPKTKASVRDVPMPQVVMDALGDHLQTFGSHESGLIFTLDGQPITRQRWGHLWRTPARALGVPTGEGLHALRHYYASLLIRHGESVKVVQERLGHASATETLDTYSHLWPDSDDRTRQAVDLVLGSSADSLADSLRTVEA